MQYTLFPVKRDDPAPNGFTKDELKGIIVIDVSGRPVKSLEGISVFSDLQILNCGETPITELDVSSLRSLAGVSATSCTSLRNVRCRGCSSLKDLRLSGSPVSFLDCSHTRVSIDGTGCESTLQFLSCQAVYKGAGMFLEYIFLDNFPSLSKLYCQDNDITAIRCARSSKVSHIEAERNPLHFKEISFDRMKRLRFIRVSRSPFEGEVPWYRKTGVSKRCWVETVDDCHEPLLSRKWPLEYALQVVRKHAATLRQEGEERAARRYLSWWHAEINRRKLLDASNNTNQNLKATTLACEIELDYAASCTQEALSVLDVNYQNAAVDIERNVHTILQRMCTKLCRTRRHSPAFKHLKWLLYRSKNSLGVSYQRPKSIFPDRDTAYAVELCGEAYAYFLCIAVPLVKNKENNQSDERCSIIVNAIRYCGNYAAALYQRAMDYQKSGALLTAREYMRRSIEVRLDIETALIVPEFGHRSQLYCRSLTLRADGERRMAEFCINKDEGDSVCMKATRHYGEALRILTELERDEGSDSSGGSYATYRVARLRAQSGQARALGHLGNHLLAYYLHRATFLERVKCLGEAHIDTL